MSCAYFVQSHCQPRQTVRLLSTLRRGSPEAKLVLGSCPTGEAPPARELDRLEVLHFRHRHPARRGYWSLLEPYFDAVELLAGLPSGYDWLVHLSGQDYPVQPLVESERVLAESQFDGYLTWLERAECGSEQRRRWRRRYQYRYFVQERKAWPLRVLRLFNSVQPFWHVYLSYEPPRLGFRVWKSPFSGDLELRVGSQWTTLRRACAERVAAANHDRRRVACFERTICPDEAFAQTVLVNDRSWRLHNDHLRFIDPRFGRDGHARILGVDNLSAMVGHGYQFARKFDEQLSAPALDWLDRHLLT